jgi:hypothetical protein
MVGWVVSLDAHGSGEVQAFSELGPDSQGDLRRLFSRRDILPSTPASDSLPIRINDLVVFHACDNDRFPRAFNLSSASPELVDVLAQERTLDRVAALRTALADTLRWRPGGPWLGEGLAVTGRLLSDRKFSRAEALLDLAAYEPSAGPRRGAGYSSVPEVHTLRALANILASEADKALRNVHAAVSQSSRGGAFLALLHLAAHLLSGVSMSSAENQRCLPAIQGALAPFASAQVFDVYASIASFLHDTERLARSKGLPRHALYKVIQLLLNLGATLQSASRFSDVALPPTLSVTANLPPISDLVRLSRAVVWIPAARLDAPKVRLITQRFLEHEGAGAEETHRWVS